MPQKEEGKFIREQIKDKPKKEWKIEPKGILASIGYGLIFGLVSCLVFCGFKPYAEEWLAPETEQVHIPADTRTDDAENRSEKEDKKSKKTEKKKYIIKSLTLEDYQDLQEQLYQVGKDLNHSVVTVTGIKEDKDLFDDSYQETGQYSGLLIGETSKAYLVLTQYQVAKDVEKLRVTFYNHVTVSAKLKGFDGNTGLAVLAVPVSGLSERTRSYIKVAELGNSLNCGQGDLAVAVGSPMGSPYSILTGKLTSVLEMVSMEDANYHILNTDMISNGEASGTLVNTRGEIIGIMLPTDTLKKKNSLAAVSVSELKELIERMSNGKKIAYLGLVGSTVTEEISKEYDLPRGVYIKEVAIGSPAVDGGLRNGDVITAINGRELSSMEVFQARLLAVSPGKELTLTVRRQDGRSYKKLTCKIKVGYKKGD